MLVCFTPKTIKTQIQKTIAATSTRAATDNRYPDKRSNIDRYKSSNNVTHRQNLLTWKEKREDKLSNPLPPNIYRERGGGEHNPASNWKLTRLRQVGYRLDTSRYLLTVSRTHSSPRLDLIHQAGNYKGKKEYGKIKTKGRGRDRFDFSSSSIIIMSMDVAERCITMVSFINNPVVVV